MCQFVGECRNQNMSSSAPQWLYKVVARLRTYGVHLCTICCAYVLLIRPLAFAGPCFLGTKPDEVWTAGPLPNHAGEKIRKCITTNGLETLRDRLGIRSLCVTDQDLEVTTLSERPISGSLRASKRLMAAAEFLELCDVAFRSFPRQRGPLSEPSWRTGAARSSLLQRSFRLFPALCPPPGAHILLIDIRSMLG